MNLILRYIFSLGNDRRQSCWLLAGLSAAIAAFFSFFVFPHLIEPLNVHYMRADGYYDLAESLLSGRGFVFGDEPRFNMGAFKREPLYPLFLAGLLALPGFPLTLILAQIALHTGITLLSHRLFLDFGTGDRQAFWAAALFAVYPFSFWYVGKPTPENLSPLFMLLNVWLLQRYLSRPAIWPAALWGISWAGAVLSKSNLILLGPIGFLVVAGYGVRRPVLLIHIAVAMLLFAIGISPWVARNYALSGRFIWGSTMSGTSFFVGNRNADWETILRLGTELKGEDAVYAEWKKIYYEKRAVAASQDPFRLEAETDAVFDARVVPWIKSNKAVFGRKVLINAATLWFITHEWAKSLILLVFQGPMFLGALVGAWFAWRRGLNSLVAHMMIIIGGFYIVCCAILADARYTHVFLPFIAYFAVGGVAQLSSGSAKNQD